MILFQSEYEKNHSTYTFGYANYAVQQEGDTLSDFYKQGYLPYSGDLSLEHSVYYMCRSLRVDLKKFNPGSENRRVERKFSEFDLEFSVIKKSEIDALDHNLKVMALDYSARRYTTGQMSEERFAFIYKHPANTHLIKVQSGENTAGIIFVGIDDKSLHFWFSFFEENWASKGPFGKWLMLQTINWAKQKGKNYVYLGTCYGQNSLYKARDFKGIEFFDGGLWSQDLEELKRLCKEDTPHEKLDRFKMLEDRNKYLDKVLGSRR